MKSLYGRINPAQCLHANTHTSQEVLSGERRRNTCVGEPWHPPLTIYFIQEFVLKKISLWSINCTLQMCCIPPTIRMNGRKLWDGSQWGFSHSFYRGCWLWRERWSIRGCSVIQYPQWYLGLTSDPDFLLVLIQRHYYAVNQWVSLPWSLVEYIFKYATCILNGVSHSDCLFVWICQIVVMISEVLRQKLKSAGCVCVSRQSPSGAGH